MIFSNINLFEIFYLCFDDVLIDDFKECVDILIIVILYKVFTLFYLILQEIRLKHLICKKEIKGIYAKTMV